MEKWDSGKRKIPQLGVMMNGCAIGGETMTDLDKLSIKLKVSDNKTLNGSFVFSVECSDGPPIFTYRQTTNNETIN